jgi:hypothetical protein
VSEGFFLAGNFSLQSLKIPRRMFEGMVEELGSFHVHPLFFSGGGGGADILV